MNKDEIKKKFEEIFIEGSCFADLDDLIKDRTSVEINAPRALIAVNLKGAWMGFREGLKQGK